MSNKSEKIQQAIKFIINTFLYDIDFKHTRVQVKDKLLNNEKKIEIFSFGYLGQNNSTFIINKTNVIEYSSKITDSLKIFNQNDLDNLPYNMAHFIKFCGFTIMCKFESIYDGNTKKYNYPELNIYSLTDDDFIYYSKSYCLNTYYPIMHCACGVCKENKDGSCTIY